MSDSSLYNVVTELTILLPCKSMSNVTDQETNDKFMDVSELIKEICSLCLV